MSKQKKELDFLYIAMHCNFCTKKFINMKFEFNFGFKLYFFGLK